VLRAAQIFYVTSLCVLVNTLCTWFFRAGQNPGHYRARAA